MKKWVLISSFVFLLLTWQVAQLMLTIGEDREALAQPYIDFIHEEMGYSVHDIDRYHGEQLYFVFTAQDAEENEYYIFINQDRDVYQMGVDQIQVNQEAAGQLALSDHEELKRVMRVNPAYTEDQFNWEIIALDEEDRMQYLYYTMTDGAFIKRYIMAHST